MISNKLWSIGESSQFTKKPFCTAVARPVRDNFVSNSLLAYLSQFRLSNAAPKCHVPFAVVQKMGIDVFQLPFPISCHHTQTQCNRFCNDNYSRDISLVTDITSFMSCQYTLKSITQTDKSYFKMVLSQPTLHQDSTWDINLACSSAAFVT